MGAAQSRECLELSDDEDTSRSDDSYSGKPKNLDYIDSQLNSLHLSPKNGVKLYLHVGGNSPKWIISEKYAGYEFSRSIDSGRVLVVGDKIRAKVSSEMQLKVFGDQNRVDFVSNGVWALKFLSNEGYREFVIEFQNCLFENSFGLGATEDNKLKVYGKEYIGWVKPDQSNDAMWKYADTGVWESPILVKENHDLKCVEVSTHGEIQSVALGALDNSFLVCDTGIQVVKNLNRGIHGKGLYINFSSGRKGSSSVGYSTPKALLMRGETCMILMSQFDESNAHSTGIHQLDIETGKLVTEWKFGKDGTEITMRDITNDSKGSQLEPSNSTFLGLDDNVLCQWDIRDKRGIVESIAGSNSPVLHWANGHQFCTGTNFQCFASTGDGSIVVGLLDGRILLYSKASMRHAKTAFPSLGSPITSVDVTYDGKWILGTTDSCLILICTLFTDKDGDTKTAFSGSAGNKIPPPRLLKLTPLDCHMAGANKFHGGYFSWVTESGKQERHLVGTVGKFSVVWNFQQVKDTDHHCYQNQQGLKSCYCYKLMLNDGLIIESRFMHDKFAVENSPEAPLVVATPMKISSFSMSDEPTSSHAQNRVSIATMPSVSESVSSNDSEAGSSRKLSKKEAAKLERQRKRHERAAASTAHSAVKVEVHDALASSYGDVPLEDMQSKGRTKRVWTHVEALCKSMEGEEVRVRGRAQTLRPTGKNMFIVMREGKYTVQCVLSEAPGVVSPLMVKFAKGLSKESIVEIVGMVSVPNASINATTQQVEIIVRNLYCISRALSVLPLNIDDASRSEAEIKKAEQDGKKLPRVNQDTRLNNRVLELRTPANQAIFMVEYMVEVIFREVMASKGFIGIHTPKLMAGTSEGGAAVFKLDYKGQPACLAQSAQLHKQMSICADFKRVFEVAKAFRAEDSSTHRHLCEFVTLVAEMEINEHYSEVMDLVETLFVKMFDDLNRRCELELDTIRRQFPFEPLKYRRSNVRISFEEGVRMLKEAGVEIDPLGDLNTEAEKKLGQLVLEKYETNFYMLHRFPLRVRPFFTMPCADDPEYSNSFDVFVRGEEILSGSQRIHIPELLEERARHWGIDLKCISAYMDAFRYGAPLHGGFGAGLERIVMLFCGLNNIRKTSMFPRDPTRLAP